MNPHGCFNNIIIVIDNIFEGSSLWCLALPNPHQCIHMYAMMSCLHVVIAGFLQIPLDVFGVGL